MLPLLLYMFAAGPLGALRREGRPLAGAVAGLAALLLLASLNIDFGTRVQSVVNFAAKPTEFLRPTYSFTRDERSEASGRAYVWSQYYNAYRESDPLRKIAGHGPDTWETAFGVYAQNTILSYLYEFGALGALAAIAIWLVMLGPLLRAPRRQRLPLLLMHLGFAILNMSTMPFWQIEGLIMYGLICGYTIYYGQQARISRPRAAMPPPAEGNLQLIRPA
jgi:O-antigen ligase